MKKTHRAVLSILLVLTLLATLPLTALADTQTVPDNTTVSPPMDVTTDQEMENNTGTIGTNGGTITNNGEPQDDGTNSNPTSGTVQNNFAGGTIVNNYGTVTDNKMETNDPSATIVYNYGIVKNNSGSNGGVAVVENNMAGGIVQNNQAGGTVVNNNAGGTVQYNEAGGTVTYNHGTVGTDNAQGPNGNDGTVGYNYIDGVVYNNAGGIVTTNFGTVHQKSNYTTDDNINTTTTTTFYGLQAVDDEENGAQYYLGSYASNSGEAIDLESKLTDIKREGYKLVSYTPYTYNKDSNSDDHLEPQTSGNPIFVGKENNTDFNSTSYYITAPTLLKLTWEKIASIFKPAASTDSSVGGGAEAVPTSYKPKYIGLGSVIFINEKGYKVVEIKDDAYVVVSFDALSDEDVQDLDALFAKLFTPEQQKLIKNVGQLLDSEDVLTVFGTPGNHPVYEISKDLVK